MSCASCGALGLETSRLLINPGSASVAQCLHCPESDLLLQSSEMTRCAITGRKQLQQIAALFDRLVAWTSNVGEIVMPGPVHRLRHYWTKFAHTAKYKIKPQATAIDTNQIAIFPNLGTPP
jgi:hypothetical protein